MRLHVVVFLYLTYSFRSCFGRVISLIHRLQVFIDVNISQSAVVTYLVSIFLSFYYRSFYFCHE